MTVLTMSSSPKAESFNVILERAKLGVFHYFSKEHIQRFLHEIGFRWNHKNPELKRTRKGKLKFIMEPLPVIARLRSLYRMRMAASCAGLLIADLSVLLFSLCLGYRSVRERD
jgi:hypothetical protein